MPGRSISSYRKCRARFALLCLLTAALGSACYEAYFGLGSGTDLMAYAEQICGPDAQALEQQEMPSLTLVGVVDAQDRYTLVGFVRSPISGRHQEAYMTYADEQPPEMKLHGVICLFTSKGFSHSFGLYAMTEEVVPTLDINSHLFYPITIKGRQIDIGSSG